MSQDKKTVTVNGRRYDVATGLALNSTTPATPGRKYADIKKSPHAKIVHSAVQKSKTLHRKVVKKPKSTAQTVVPPRKIGRNMDIARSKLIARFAPTAQENQPAKKVTSKSQSDIGPVKHPLTAKVGSTKKADLPVKPKNSRETKEEAISAALKAPKSSASAKRKTPPKLKRFINVFSIGFICLVIGAAAAYTNLPSLSVKVAGAQAGVNASYPGYKPDGYRFRGPASFSNNEVSLTFRANTGNKYFTIKQSKSSWDSSAVRDYAQTILGEDFVTIRQSGWTIYTYAGKAAWVNAGILYTVDGDARLTNEQIRRLATSL